VVVIPTGEKISSLVSKFHGSLIDLLGEWYKIIILYTILDDEFASHRLCKTSDEVVDCVIVERFVQV
jgi:hypothetical protein